MENKTQTLIKLLRHGGLCVTDIQVITGWPIKQVRKTLDNARMQGLIHHNGAWRGFYFVDNEIT